MQGDPITGSIRSTNSEDKWVNVQTGLEYAVLGVCDQDCSDIDIKIEDDNGNTLVQDYEKDDHPLVRFTSRTARVKIHVYMSTCSREPCFYGVALFSRGGGGNAVANVPNSANAASGGNTAERWLSTVRNELDRYSGQLLVGFGLQGSPLTGSIRSTSSEDVSINLQPGVEAAILGVCDEDCSDIDLKLYDDGGNEIASNYEKDDHPIVRVTPIRAGRFKVHIYMATCSHEPCFYGVGVYVRGAGGAAVANTTGSGTATGAGSERWLHTVRTELDKYGTQLIQDGYALQGTSYTGSLRKTSSEDLNVTLQAGFDYALLGVCDSDCGDIDLALKDASANQVDSDYDKNDHPTVRVTPARDGQYIIRIYMASCSTEPCYYGIGVFQRRSRGAKGGEDQGMPRESRENPNPLRPERPGRR
jgi:hypothetical protein